MNAGGRVGVADPYRLIQGGCQAQAFSDALDLSPGRIGGTIGRYRLDRDHRIRAWNDVMTRWTGVQAADVVGRRACDVFQWPGHAAWDHAYRTALSGAIYAARTMQGMLGRFGPVRVTPTRGEDGAVTGVAVMIWRAMP